MGEDYKLFDEGEEREVFVGEENKSLEVKPKPSKDKRPPSLQVSARYFRFTVPADTIIKAVMAEKGFKTYSFTANWIIEQWGVLAEWRAKQRKRIGVDMDECGLKAGDFL